jgi:protein TonB
MPVEEKKSAEQIGTLGSCLIDGDSEQKSRERKTKRRALTLSIALQSLAIVAIILVPLLGHTEKISLNVVTPIPPYRHHPVHPVADRAVRPQPPRSNTLYQPSNIPPRVVTTDNPTRQNSSADDTVDIGPVIPGAPNRDGLGIEDNRNGPTPPHDELDRNQKKRITVGGAVQQAMLQHKVDPCYPPLARQMRRSGQVRIHAVISTDGTVESLQVMDGDPLFIQCAMDAVRQWRYRPTALNGVPVEVETVITVVYTLNQ